VKNTVHKLATTVKFGAERLRWKVQNGGQSDDEQAGYGQ
jgi:hypothetical protein